MSKFTNDVDKKVFSSNLKYLMMKNNLKYVDLAARLGLSKSAISNYIAGISMPRTDVLLKIAEVFGVQMEDLIKPAQGRTSFEEGEYERYPVPIFSNSLVSAETPYRNDNLGGGTITFPFPVFGDHECYAVRVTDDLLALSGIKRRSIVIFASATDVKNGKLAAVLLKDEMRVAVRRVTIEGNKITLSVDDASKAQHFNVKDNKITILGKVVFATFIPN